MTTTPTTITVAAPVAVVITYVTPETTDRMVQHLERKAAIQEVAAAVTRWYYTQSA